MKFKNMKQENFVRLPSFLDPTVVVGDFPKRSNPRIFNDWVLWLEQKPDQLGRTTVLIRRWGSKDSEIQELTPFPINVKSRLHGYGGGSIAIAHDIDHLFLVF